MSSFVVIAVKPADFPKVLRRHLLAHPNVARQALRRAARRALPVIADTIARVRPHKPQDTGHYTARWTTEPMPDGALIYNPLMYAKVVETGRSPHPDAMAAGGVGPGAKWPPRDEIERWVRRKFRGSLTIASGVAAGFARAGGRRVNRRDLVERTVRSLVFLVRRKIGTQGTPGKFVLRDSLPKIIQIAQAEIIRALNEPPEVGYRP